MPTILFPGFSFVPHASIVTYSTPIMAAVPDITSYFSGGTPNNTYFISATGSDTTGTGSILNPWASVEGAKTGGAGTAAAAGDLIHFRGGTYGTVATNSGGIPSSSGNFTTSGTVTDRIVFAAYSGETPVFSDSVGDARTAFALSGNYLVVDGLTFSTYASIVTAGDYPIIQNCSFPNAGNDPKADQISYSKVYFLDGTTNVSVLNNLFLGPYGSGGSSTHCIKTYTGPGQAVVNGVTIRYNRFYNNGQTYGAINYKGCTQNCEIAYNSFESVNKAVSFGTNYSVGLHTGHNYHHNVFDTIATSIIDRNGSNTYDIGVNFHDNLILNSTGADLLVLRCDDNGCFNSGTVPIGEFYNNAIYDIADCINPQTTSDFTNYPNYWNYNAYPSTTLRDTAENQNLVGSASWQSVALIQALHNVIRTGTAGEGIYTINSDNGFVNAGRYADTIGGFA